MLRRTCQLVIKHIDTDGKLADMPLSIVFTITAPNPSIVLSSGNMFITSAILQTVSVFFFTHNGTALVMAVMIPQHVA